MDEEMLASALLTGIETRRGGVRGKNNIDTDKPTGPELAACESAFIAQHLPALVQWTRQKWPKAWDDIVTEHVEEALLDFLGKVKNGIWPIRQAVGAHLRQAAWRNVRDGVKAANRRRLTEARYATERSKVTPAFTVADGDGSLLDGLELLETERAALDRWLEGESTFLIAQALGLSNLTREEQMREVKRFKDRLKKRGERLRRR